MLSAVMLNAIMLSVVMLSVVAPQHHPTAEFGLFCSVLHFLIVMLSALLLGVVILNFVMLSVASPPVSMIQCCYTFMV
jgi:hypothetical protein